MRKAKEQAATPKKPQARLARPMREAAVKKAATPRKPPAKPTRETAVRKAATPKKPLARPTRETAVKKAATPKRPDPGFPAPFAPMGPAEPLVSKTRLPAVASKVPAEETEAPISKPRPSLPRAYDESRLLLFARDPQTLFAAWDMAPSMVKELKARIGARALAVSTLTLRLTNAGGETRVLHVGRGSRSRYLAVDSAPSFIAEIGYTTPTGRFEFIARSAPCFVPMNLLARRAWLGKRRRFAMGYREAGALARRGLLASTLSERTRPSAIPENYGRASFGASAHRVLGGASDLYRR